MCSLSSANKETTLSTIFFPVTQCLKSEEWMCKSNIKRFAKGFASCDQWTVCGETFSGSDCTKQPFIELYTEMPQSTTQAIGGQ